MQIGGLPRVRVSKGSFSTGRLISSWLRTFSRHGGIIHDHCPPSPDNLRKLRADPPAKLVLLIRDPVTAALSLGDYVIGEHMDKCFGREVTEVDLAYLRQLEGPAQRTALFQKFFPPLVAWLEGWLALAAEDLSGCRIDLLKFKEAVQDSVVTLSRLEAFFDGGHRCFDLADDRCRRQVDDLFELLRSGKSRTITGYRGKRPALLNDTEQELIWRASRSCPNLARVYDLGSHLR